MFRQNPILRMFLTGVVLVGPAAWAMSPPRSPPQFWTITRTLPEADATDVLRDGSILFDFEAVVAEGEPEFDPPEPTERLEVIVRDTVTGARVEGQLGTAPRYVWRSANPLVAQRTYELTAVLEQPYARPSTATGVTELRLSFQTGDQFAPPLELEGELTFDIHDSMLGTTAAVQLPVPTGGLPEHGLSYKVWLTRETPRAVGSAQPQEGAQVLANGPGELLPREDSYPLPASDVAFRPCITLEVSDVASTAAAFSCHPDAIRPGSTIGCSGCAGTGVGESAVGLALLGFWLRRNARRKRRS